MRTKLSCALLICMCLSLFSFKEDCHCKDVVCAKTMTKKNFEKPQTELGISPFYNLLEI